MSMESRMCMNSCCRATSTVQWKKGWPTKSGQPALLCFNCGSAYDNFLYCHTFHAHQSGWRECSLCNKRLHCGCSASLPFLDILDFGGVSCITCLHPPPPSPLTNSVIPDGISSQPQPPPPTNHTNTTHLHNSLMATNLDSPNMATGNILHLGSIIDPILPRFLPQTHADATNTNTSQGTLPIPIPIPLPLLYTQPTQDKNIADPKIMQGPQIPSLNMSLHSPSETSNPPLSFSNGVEEDKTRPTLTHSGQKRHLFPKPSKTNPAKVSNANKTPSSPMRVARPPAEGRLRNQLLPRYWPRITDQELQKLSGDLNTAIVPLFEKILSASDASRIGRLVLPKACAEAYFPPINQSEGLPLKIQDVKGNEWAFQFRFWPNNNSRMYVLEGVTPCIQSMQLQAGDTVTFSRIDPGGKLVIGYRKASNTLEIQDSQASLVNSSSPPSGECLYPGVADGLAVGNILLGLQPSRAQDDHPNILPGKLETVKGETILNKCEKLSIKNENALQQPELTPEKKRTRNISSKSKRLIMRSEDAVELRLSWEETQELLRPPPSLEPNIVMVDDIEFEEYSEPPVFGKKTYFTSRLCGVKDQWAQCDKCSKWRKLPADVFLPPMWTCLENIWDSSRSSCDTSEEMSSMELEIIFRINKDFKKGKAAAEIPKLGHGCEPSGLDALATAATLSDHTEGSGGTTTRHPRHRPGCTCIVCIQSPSGKGKHKSSCVCNVCLTVKRRFKTLMMRKKKRQGEREAELALRKSHPIKKPRLLKNTSVDCGMPDKVCLENDFQENLESEDKGHIDLNCHPVREEEPKVVMQPNAEMMNSNELENLLPKQQPTDDGSSSKEKCDTLMVGLEQEGDDHGSKKGTSD